MLNLEEKLLQALNHISKEDAQRDSKKFYKKIISTIQTSDLDSKEKLRYLKNYLITLNTLIYMNSKNYPVCKKKLFCIRNNFLKKIEKEVSIEDLVLLGEEMVSTYLKVIHNYESPIVNPNINDALDYIKNNLEKDLSLEEVASAIHVSKSYLSHLFKKYTGYSFSYYVNKLKIKKAKELLANTKLSLIDIAMECGFNSQSYFCRVFSQFEGITPKQYRILAYRTKKDSVEAL